MAWVSDVLICRGKVCCALLGGHRVKCRQVRYCLHERTSSKSPVVTCMIAALMQITDSHGSPVTKCLCIAAGRTTCIGDTHHFTHVLRGEVHASRPPIDLVVVQAGPTHSGCVQNGCHVHKVVQQQIIEEGLIAVLHSYSSSEIKQQQHCLQQELFYWIFLGINVAGPQR